VPTTQLKILWSDISGFVKFGSSGGYPSLKRKRDHVKEMEGFVASVSVSTVFKAILDPFVTFNRTQAKDDGTYGIRQVYCPTWKVTLLEIMFGAELTNHFMSSDTSHLILGKTQLQVSERMKRLKQYHKLCLDFSKFDQTVNPYVLITAFDIISKVINIGRFHNIYWMLVSHIVCGLIYHPFTGFIHRTRGMVSGSYFTNLIDGVANLLVT
jgi:hypothetical protein